MAWYLVTPRDNFTFNFTFTFFKYLQSPPVWISCNLVEHSLLVSHSGIVDVGHYDILTLTGDTSDVRDCESFCWET